METTKNSLFSRLMSIVFIAMGIFLGIYAFFANATTWTVGAITWDNSNYLTWSFRDQNPTTGDIITALYGSGDENTAYTQHWSGYTSGSCLASGMQVEFTGIIPTILSDNTIYVIASWNYDITTPIEIGNCSALISSGIVTINKTSTIHAIYGSSIEHSIIENIHINWSGHAWHWIFLDNSSNNNTLNKIQTYNNSDHGLSFDNFSNNNTINNSQFYGNKFGINLYNSSNNIITDSQAYNNTIYGVYLYAAYYNDLTNISSHDNNQDWVVLNTNSNNNNLSGILSYNNIRYGIKIGRANANTIDSSEFYNNLEGINIEVCSGNTISNSDVYSNSSNGIDLNINAKHTTLYNISAYDNIEHNISLTNASNNILTNIVANTSETAMWLYLSNSSGNTFSWVTAYGNYYAGVHLYNSSYNTWTNIISNSNEGWLYLENSTDNSFTNFSVANSTKNGVVLVSGSEYNTIRQSTISGNMNHGIYISNSDYNTITGSIFQYNQHVGMLTENSSNNIIFDSDFLHNGVVGVGNGIALFNSSWTIISSSEMSYNNDHWITLAYSFNNQIIDSTVNENNENWIHLINSTFNSISWCMLSWNRVYWIGINNWYSNTITSSHDYWTTFNSIYIGYSTGNSISLFSWNREIHEYHPNGLFLYTNYDTYTQENNYIRLDWYLSASLTWSLLSWDTFDVYFEALNISDWASNYISLLFNTSFTIFWDVWDGILYSPVDIHAWTKSCVVWETGTQLLTSIYKTIEIVSWDTYLSIDGGNTTINYKILSWTSGQFVSILASNDGETWKLNFPDEWCILNTNLFCEFTTTWDIKLFAFWIPGLYFTGTTQSWDIITSGWYYNTGIRITYTWLNISGATLNGVPYINNTLITGNNTYTFTLTDTNENSTWVTFTIDRIAPMFTGETIISGTPIISWWYYNEADIYIDFSDLYLSGAILSWIDNSYFSGNFDGIYTSTTWGVYIFTVRDLAGNSTGMTFTIDRVNPLVTGNYPTSGLHISGINNIPFSRTGWDNIAIDTYTLSITGTQIYTWTTTANTSTVYLPNGSYTRHIIANDRAGNTWSSQTFPFIITAPYTGSITLTWPNAKYIWTQRFTKDWAGIYMRANDPTQYTISWAIDTSPLTWTFSSRAIHNVLLTGTNGAKDIFVTMDNGSWEIISKTFLVQLDTVAPIPTLTSPINGTNIAGTITLNRSAGPDAAGLSWYQYLISPTDTFGTIFHSWSTTTSSVTIPNGTISYTGTLYRKVIFIDRLGNTWSSATQSFNYTWGTTDITPSSFHFNDVTNADLDEIYASNTITITGMTPNTSVLASINRWALYISGHMVGVTGYVQNGRTVKIELNSSYKYDTPVESTLTIGWVSDTFKVTTKKWTSASTEDYEDIETDLSNTQKLMVIAIFETLKDLYGGDKEEEFFNTMLLMLDEKMDEYDDTDDEYIALKYLYDLIEQYYDDGEFWGDTIDLAKRIINGIYTAPNGKKYRITYDSSTKRFTSTNFVVPKYFPTLDTLKYIIDINNPAWSKYSNSKPILARWKNANIDGTRQTSPYTAPNKKVFYFFKDITGRYSSYTFTSERYFNSLNEVKEFIYNSNKK